MGKPVMTDSEYNALRLELKKLGSPVRWLGVGVGVGLGLARLAGDAAP